MQINIKEFEKCKTGKEFKANFISYPGPKPPVGMPKWFKEWSEKIYEKRQPHWFKEWSETEFQSVKDILKEHDKRFDKQDEFNNEIRTFMKNTNEHFDKIEDILERNNLH